MKMIPANVDFIKDNESNAERKVFDIISKIENDFLKSATCFHSIRVPDHIKNDMGECDFFIISKGIAIALEVKGGRVKYDPETNAWLFINRAGNVNRKKIGPFQQADEVMYSIRGKLRKKFYELNNFLFIKGVVFPDASADLETIEVEKYEYIDQMHLNVKEFNLWISNLIKINLKKPVNKKYEKFIKDPSHFSNELMQDLKQHLRPSYDIHQSIGASIHNAKDRYLSLTDDQYEKMDELELNKRIVVTGGAGTGKTLLAQYEAKRLSKLNKKVVFSCSSEIMSETISELFKDIKEVNVINFNDFDEYPENYADALVIDEGQDIINLDNLEKIEKILKGGLEKGTWRIFCDPNNQSNIDGYYEENALNVLSELSSCTIQKLNTNVRNTKNILDFVSIATGADLEVSRFGEGQKVATSIYQNDNFKNKLIELLDKLIQQQTPFKDICIVTTGKEEDIYDELPLNYQKRSIIHNLKNLNYDKDKIKISSVKNIKGFESSCVIFTDNNFNKTEDLLNNYLYVGMTRSMLFLCLLISEKTKDIIKSKIKK